MKARTPLTARQQEALDFIKSFIEERHYPPTIREMCDAMEISSPNGMMFHIHALERKGYIGRDPRVARAVWIEE